MTKIMKVPPWSFQIFLIEYKIIYEKSFWTKCDMIWTIKTILCSSQNIDFGLICNKKNFKYDHKCRICIESPL